MKTIREWLFSQTATQDVPDLDLKTGDSYSLAWTRQPPASRGNKRFEECLLRWFQGGYRLWLVEDANRTETLDLIDRVEDLTAEAAKRGQPEARTGGNVLIRSVLIDTLNTVRSGDKDPVRIAQLANAWSSLGRVADHADQLKLSAQEVTDLGLAALKDQIKANPEALKLFNELYDKVTASPKPTS